MVFSYGAPNLLFLDDEESFAGVFLITLLAVDGLAGVLAFDVAFFVVDFPDFAIWLGRSVLVTFYYLYKMVEQFWRKDSYLRKQELNFISDINK